MRILIVPILMVVAALALGYVLLPREQELAFMQFKAGQLEEAQAHYEERLRSGDLSVSTVNSLVSVYAAGGEMDRAVGLFEDFADRHAKDLEVQRRLGRLYGDAMRPSDYRRNLETLYGLSPDEATLRELIETYAFEGAHDRRREALQALVEIYGGTRDDALALARLLAAGDRRGQAADVLLRRGHRRGVSLDAEEMALLVSLLLDQGRHDEALERTRSWLGDEAPAARVVEYVNRFVARNRIEDARRILVTAIERSGNRDTLRLAHVRLLLNTDRRPEARRELQALLDEGGVSGADLPAFVDLALGAGAADLALAQVETHDPALIPPDLLPAVLTVAGNRGRRDLVDRLLAASSRDGLADRPLAAARIALAEGDSATARHRLAEADRIDSRYLPDQVERANLHLALGRRDRARELLDGLVISPGMPEGCLPGLADLYIGTGRLETGYAVFDEFMTSRPLIPVVAGWARLAAASGRDGELIAWLDGQTRPDGDLLLAVSESAEASGATDLSLICAERLYARHPQPAARTRLAGALLAAGRVEEALAHLRDLLVTDDEAVEDLYVRALNDSGARDELVDFIEGEVYAGDLPPKREDDYLYALLDIGAGDRVLPQLYVRARDRGGPWLFAYVESATGEQDEADCVAFLGRELRRHDLEDPALLERFSLMHARDPEAAVAAARDRAYAAPDVWGAVYFDALSRLDDDGEALRAYGRVRLGRDETPVSERRAMAYRLLDLGDVETAEAVFRDLARDGGPDSADLRQLLFLWGPRPDEPEIAWLADRVRAAAPAERGAWLRHLLDRGAAAEVARLAETTGAAEEPGAQTVYALALDRLRDKDGLARLLPRIVPMCGDTLVLRQYAQIAVAHRLDDVARLAWIRLVQRRPDDREGLLWLGSDALQGRRWDEAETYLRTGVDRHAGDHRLHYVLAEVLTEQRRRDEAAAHYETTLRLLADVRPQTVAMSLTRANALARLGRSAEAQSAFERLLASRPDDLEARADYASLLLDIGQPERAREILELD